MKEKIFFLIIFIIGILLRINNLSPFKIYPDSFQNLVVAQNILTYQSVVGFLGPQGMLYPDFFMWTRTAYALLILVANFFTHDMTIAAQIISLAAGILAIPITYLFVKKIFNKTSYALAGSLLIALSYNHTVWSGFIMTETVSVLFMLLFLWKFFGGLTTNNTSRNNLFQDFLTGMLFAIAVMARYEYIILILSVIFLTVRKSPHPLRRLIYMVSALLLTLSFVMIQLFPLDSVLSVITEQLQDMLKLTGILIALFVGLLIGKKVFTMGHAEFTSASSKQKILKRVQNDNSKVRDDKISVLIIGVLWTFAFFLVIQMIIGQSFSLFWHELSAIRNFARHDFLLSIFSLLGITAMLQKKELKDGAFFTLLSVIFLVLIYHRINPGMERYMTHLIPFLLIPAAYGIVTTYRINYSVISRSKMTRDLMGISLPLSGIEMTKLVVFVLLVILQITISYQGLHISQDPSWFRISYEEKAAQMVGKFLTQNCHTEFISASSKNQQKIPKQVRDDNNCNVLLIVSLPEPYFYNLHMSTQSVADTPPFIYIDNVKDDQKILIVEDMGMHAVFPNFTKFLESHLKSFEEKRFFVHENFHVTDTVLKEKYPVVLYEITLGELKTKIKNNKL